MKRVRPQYPKLKVGQYGRRSDGALVIREAYKKTGLLPDYVLQILRPKK